MRIFPQWMRILGRQEVAIEGVDCRIHDAPDVYRRIVKGIKEHESAVGGLVTTHKIDLLHAARDLFDELDPYARELGEISSISKRDGRLEGHAKDPITVGMSMKALLGAGYFARTGGQVLIFGAGGSSAATILYLLTTPDDADRPRKIWVVNRSQERLDALRTLMDRHTGRVEAELIRNSDPAVNDDILERLPDASLIINATGMGKDIPGSPVSLRARFPRSSVAWEFNYRGELDFFRQAAAQRESRGVRVEDGWLYFLHGWTQVLAQVLHFELSEERFARLAQSAGAARG